MKHEHISVLLLSCCIMFCYITLSCSIQPPPITYYDECVRVHYLLIEGYRDANYSPSSLNTIVPSEIDAFLTKYKNYNNRLSSCRIIMMYHKRYAKGDFTTGVLDSTDPYDRKLALGVLNKEEMDIIDRECEKYGYTVDFDKIKQEVIDELKKNSKTKDMRVR